MDDKIMQSNLSLVNIENLNFDLGKFPEVAERLLVRTFSWIGSVLRYDMTSLEAEKCFVKGILDTNISDLDKSIILIDHKIKLKEYANKKDVVVKALAHLKEDAKPEDVDDDLYNFFFDKVRLVSNDDLKNIWARILAEEVNKPGTINKKTIDVLSCIGRQEAEIFRNIAPFVICGSMVVKNLELIEKYGIRYSDIILLGEVGLINITPADKVLENATFLADMNIKAFVAIPMKPDAGSLRITGFPLTETGKAIFKILTVKYNVGYMEELGKELLKRNPGWSIEYNEILSRDGNIVQFK